MVDNSWPRKLDEEGCLYGQGYARRIGNLEEQVESLETKIDRMTWALAALALSIASASVTMWLR